jgi:hypothetical protein
MQRVKFCLVWALLASCVCGCKAKIFRAETTLHSDGSVSRAIYQPVEETPEAARDAAKWKGITFASRVPHEDWRGAIAELPSAPANKDNDYFAAWGEFSEASQLPQSALIDAPEGIADGTLEREYERNDYVLVTEHRWRETLTDVVTLDDMHQARHELAEIVIPLAEKFLQQAYGNDHDIQPLVDWMHQEGRPLFYELTDAYFDLATRKGPHDETVLLATFEPILKRHGVSMRDEGGALIELNEVVGRRIKQLFVEKLRRRNGDPASAETIAELMQWLGVETRPDGIEPQRLNTIFKQVLAEKFSDEAEMKAALLPLAVRILGIYGADFGPERQFEYQHQMPGTLVETSGELMSDNETLWRFSDSQAYPAGYTMSCRSLEPNVTLEQKLLARPVLTDRKAMLRYIDLLRNNEPLLAMMRICAADGSLTPLKREYDALEEAGDDGAAAFGQMLSLLEGK